MCATHCSINRALSPSGLHVSACYLIVIGFAKIVKWLLLAIFGSWNNWKMAGIFVRNQSRVPVSLVLNFTICLRLFDCVKSIGFRPVERGLKSPAITTSALGCLISRLTKFDQILLDKTMFLGCPLAVEWETKQRIIDKIDLGRLWGLKESHRDSTSDCSHWDNQVHVIVYLK